MRGQRTGKHVSDRTLGRSASWKSPGRIHRPAARLPKVARRSASCRRSTTPRSSTGRFTFENTLADEASPAHLQFSISDFLLSAQSAGCRPIFVPGSREICRNPRRTRLRADAGRGDSRADGKTFAAGRQHGQSLRHAGESRNFGTAPADRRANGRARLRGQRHYRRRLPPRAALAADGTAPAF